MVQSWYGRWNISVYTKSAWESHIVLLYEWLQNYFKTKESGGRKWCKILQKVRTANPSATTMLAVAEWQMSCLWKDLNTWKQHVENISQMCVKNSWGEAHYHATCRRDYTRQDDRYQETIKDTKTIMQRDIFSFLMFIDTSMCSISVCPKNGIAARCLPILIDAIKLLCTISDNP